MKKKKKKKRKKKSKIIMDVKISNQINPVKIIRKLEIVLQVNGKIG